MFIVLHPRCVIRKKNEIIVDLDLKRNCSKCVTKVLLSSNDVYAAISIVRLFNFRE